MGGMQALQWAVQYPDAVQSVDRARHVRAPLAAADRVQRGRAAGHHERPALAGRGLLRGRTRRGRGSPSRACSATSRTCPTGMERKFGRRLQDRRRAATASTPTSRSRATWNTRARPSWIASTRTRCSTSRARSTTSISSSQAARSATPSAAASAAYLFLTFSSDWLYPPYHLEEAADAARAAGRPVSYREIPSDYGHDAFLLEHEAQAPSFARFLPRAIGIIRGATQAGVAAAMPISRHRRHSPRFALGLLAVVCAVVAVGLGRRPRRLPK